jgi:RNA polymerase sigma-70 factor, ECF subfamily
MTRRIKTPSNDRLDPTSHEPITSQTAVTLSSIESGDESLEALYRDFPSLALPENRDATSHVSDEELVLSYLRDRKAQTFEILVRRYERELYTFLRRFLGDTQAAEDVFQATFLNVHLRIQQFEEGRRFRPWLYAIASNKAIDFLRRNKRHQIGSLHSPSASGDDEDALMHRLSGTDTSPEENASKNEDAARVHSALRELNEPTQQLLQLAFFQEMKYADIAEMLRIPIGTVKSRVFTAIRKLNAIWMRMEETDSRETN